MKKYFGYFLFLIICLIVYFAIMFSMVGVLNFVHIKVSEEASFCLLLVFVIVIYFLTRKNKN
jgi:hypothetical protein